MSIVKPFKGVRPKPELVEKVTSLPYDVMSEDEARELGKSKYSFLRVIRPEINFEKGYDYEPEEMYKKSKEVYETMKEKGILVKEGVEAFYIYKQTWKGNTQTGIVAGVSAWEYFDNKILKHELTRNDKEEDRLKHIETVDANTGLVFLTYKNDEKLTQLIEELIEKYVPIYDFNADDVENVFYVVSDEEDVKALKDAFAKVDKLYIADGHHRAAAGSRLAKKRKEANPNHTGNEEYNFFMAAIFPSNQLKVLDYNRVVKDLNGLSKEEFFSKLSGKFDVEKIGKETYTPKNKHDFGMYIDGEWYKLRAKPDIYDDSDPIRSLDVDILQRNLLDPVLGIKNPRTDKRIDFVGGIRGLKELERRVNSGWKVAFALFPTSIDDLMKVADRGLNMPPKSTWFEPKLRSGLIIHELD